MRGVELAGLLKCIHLKFTEMEAFVEFIQLDDFELFKAVITKFFTSVKDRIARQGESPEPIFRAVLDRWESSEIRPPSTPRSSLSTLQGTRTTRHCELRIYETPGDRAYGWHSSRRVVITTPPFEKETRCKSYCITPQMICF